MRTAISRIVMAVLAGALAGYSVLQSVLIVGFALLPPVEPGGTGSWAALLLAFLIPAGALAGGLTHRLARTRTWLLAAVFLLVLSVILHSVLGAVLN